MSETNFINAFNLLWIAVFICTTVFCLTTYLTHPKNEGGPLFLLWGSSIIFPFTSMILFLAFTILILEKFLQLLRSYVQNKLNKKREESNND